MHWRCGWPWREPAQEGSRSGLGTTQAGKGESQKCEVQGTVFPGRGERCFSSVSSSLQSSFSHFFCVFFCLLRIFFFFNVKFKHSTHWTEGEDQLRWQMIDVLGRGRTGLWRKRWRAALWPGQASPRLAALVYRRGDTWPGALSGAVGGYIQTSGHG